MALKLAGTSCRVRYPSHQILSVRKSDGLNLFAQRGHLRTAQGSEGATIKHFSEITEWVICYVLAVVMAVMATPCGHCSAFAKGCFLWGDFLFTVAEHFCCSIAFEHRFFVQNSIVFFLEVVHGYCFFNASLTILPKPPILCHLSGGKKKECGFHCAEGQENIWWDEKDMETNSHHHLATASFMW